MVKNTTSFKKAKGKKGNFNKNGKQVATPVKKPKTDLNLTLSVSTARGMATRSLIASSTWQIRRLATTIKVYLIYMLLMCI